MTPHRPDDDPMGDELRRRIAADDPARRAPNRPVDRRLLEQIMSTSPTIDRATDDTGHATASRPARGRRRRPLAAFGALAAAAAAAVGVGIATTGGPATAEPLVLSASGGDAMASCLPFTPDILASFPTVLAATATSVDGETVTLDVDRWYQDLTDSGAETVVLHAPAGMEALIGGIAFEPGGDYLISADEQGNVAYCGYTAVATPDLTASFDATFSG